jgi:hypothetical protein
MIFFFAALLTALLASTPMLEASLPQCPSGQVSTLSGCVSQREYTFSERDARELGNAASERTERER